MKAKVKTWLRNIDNGFIKSNNEKVLQCIKDYTPDEKGYIFRGHGKGISTYEMRNVLEISHQTLTSRLSELTDEGLIKVVGQTTFNDTVYSVYMFIYDIEYRKRLVRQRKEEKFLEWLKKAGEYADLMDYQTIKVLSYEQEKHQIK